MKIALINDTHAGARGENPHVDDHFFRFWENVFFPYLEEHKIDTVVHLGDVVDRRKFINYKIAYNWRTKFFDRLRDKTVHILLGNHDIYHKNTSEVNAMDELVGRYENITIHSRPITWIFDDLPICLIPWINEGNEAETQEQLKGTTASIIFGHLEVAGFEMDRGHVCTTGVPADMFKRFEAVYTGHFHHKSDNGHIYYLGNQYEITWADYNDPRGFHVFDTDTRKMTFVENPYKLFHKISYSDDTMDFTYWKDFDYTKYKNCFVKLIVLKKQNPYLFDTVLQNIYSQEPIDLLIVEDFTETLDETSLQVDQAEDVPTLLSKAIDSQELDVDSNELKRLIKDVYLEALNTEHTS